MFGVRNRFFPSAHRKTSLHLNTSMHVIKDFCHPEQPDAHGFSQALIVLISAVGQNIHRRICVDNRPVKADFALPHWAPPLDLMDAIATDKSC